MAVHPYVDYDYYLNEFHGSMEVAAFDSVRVEAEAVVDAITFGRIERLDKIPICVKNAVCAVVEESFRFAERKATGIKSANNDGYSETYDDVLSEKEHQRNVVAKARVHLANSGLLYRGFSKKYDSINQD